MKWTWRDQLGGHCRSPGGTVPWWGEDKPGAVDRFWRNEYVSVSFPPEADPETRTSCQVVYLGSGNTNRWMGKRDMEGRKEGSQCLLKPAAFLAGPVVQFAGLVQMKMWGLVIINYWEIQNESSRVLSQTQDPLNNGVPCTLQVGEAHPAFGQLELNPAGSSVKWDKTHSSEGSECHQSMAKGCSWSVLPGVSILPCIEEWIPLVSPCRSWRLEVCQRHYNMICS